MFLTLDGNDEQYDGIIFGADTGYLGNDWTENLNGESYMESSNLAGRPDLQRKIRDIVNRLAPRVSAVEDEFSICYGWNRNTALNRIYEAATGEDGVSSRRQGIGSLQGILPMLIYPMRLLGSRNLYRKNK